MAPVSRAIDGIVLTSLKDLEWCIQQVSVNTHRLCRTMAHDRRERMVSYGAFCENVLIT